MPGDAGLPVSRLELLKGGNAEVNAAALLNLLDGETGPYRDIVLFNAASALYVAGRVTSLKDGVVAAMSSIDHGKAKTALNNLVKISNLAL